MSLAGVSDAQSRRALAEVRDVAIRHGGWAPREWSLFLFRLVKGETRRLLERLLPGPLYRRLRGGINRNFTSLPQ
jgi:hypothetical protein